MKNVTDLFPAHIRKWAYVVFAFVGVGFGATQTAFVTAELAAPIWLTVAFQVYLYVGGAFGLVAAANTSTSTTNVVDVDSVEDVVVVVDETDLATIGDLATLPKHAAT